MSMMEYRDYLGTVEYSAEDHCLYGKIADIRDLVNYEASSVEELEREFRNAVDDYIGDCEKRGTRPNQPFGETLCVTTGPNLHRAVVIAANGQNINEFVCEAIKDKLRREQAALSSPEK